MKRAKRNHKGVLWLRRTTEEAKEWLATFGSPKWRKAAKIAGIEFDRLRRNRNIIYYNDGPFTKPRWIRMIRVNALVDWNDLRDTDDPNEELIILDEGFSTIEKRNRYAGNEVHDFFDIFASMYREGENDVRALIIGNEETANDPYLDYLNIKAPSFEEGIAILHGRGKGFDGSVAFERAINHNADSDLTQLLKGTDYGGFLKGDAKGVDRGLISPLPRGSYFYFAADWGTRVTFWRYGSFVWCSLKNAVGSTIRPKIDGRDDTIPYDRKTIRKRLSGLSAAVRGNAIRFDSPQAYQFGMDAISRLL